MQNQTLIHLDFSNNDFAAPEVEIIAEGLKENHSIMGIHMIGNEAVTDAMGFIVPCRSGSKLEDAKAHVFSRIKNTLEMGPI